MLKSMYDSNVKGHNHPGAFLIFTFWCQRVRFRGSEVGPRNLSREGLLMQIFLGNGAFNTVGEALSFQFAVFAGENSRPPS